MKEAKKYIGRKIRRVYDMSCVESKDIVEEFNIIESFESFKNDLRNEDWKVELLEDNILLYKCDIKTSNGNLSKLVEIRKYWEKGIFEYRDFYTKSEIKTMLEDNCLVAVQGLQEIDLEDLEKLN